MGAVTGAMVSKGGVKKCRGHRRANEAVVCLQALHDGNKRRSTATTMIDLTRDMDSAFCSLESHPQAHVLGHTS